MIFFFHRIIARSNRILNIKFNNMVRKKTPAASLSFLGKIIASSYLNEEITIRIPIKLRYTE
jgi:hypothetical protein